MAVKRWYYSVQPPMVLVFKANDGVAPPNDDLDGAGGVGAEVGDHHLDTARAVTTPPGERPEAARKEPHLRAGLTR